MKWANTAGIDELIAEYHRNYLTYYAFFDDAGGDFSDQEEAILRAQMDSSPICKLMQDALPEGVPPERISAEVFMATCISGRSAPSSTAGRRPPSAPCHGILPRQARRSNRTNTSSCRRTGNRLKRRGGDRAEGDGRYGYSTMFQTEYDREWPALKLNDRFHEFERFMCDDIRKCMIYDWRADLAQHCFQEHEYGACEGNYLWTVSCPVKRRLTVIRFHFNWFYA